MNKASLLFLYIIVLLLSPKRYISILPTIPVYPNNREEALIVKRYTDRIPPYYRSLFQKTDRSVSDAFVERVSESVRELDQMIMGAQVVTPIYITKYTINRARPAQINSEIRVLTSTTADTPAYPSGHAFQAYYLAHVLSKRYPPQTDELWRLADECALSRVYAGLHYPSDNHFSKTLVKILYR